MDKILYYSLTAFAVLFTLAAHEFAHAYTAYRLGDGTARSLGRLTLNPLKHLDPVGAICMLLFHVGWAKPVPINARNFKNPIHAANESVTQISPKVNSFSRFF